MRRWFGVQVWLVAVAGLGQAAELHIAVSGKDNNPGTKDAPLRTIQRAADMAHPGDTITVHAGTYRERVNPPRGGESDAKRIVYQAAPGEKVEIKGSEVVTGWGKVTNDTWKVVVPNTFFGKFNPYSDVIKGDWCGNGAGYHSGSVYLNGEWLKETTRQSDVLRAAGSNALWFAKVDATNTTLWAQFAGVDPNREMVEINVRQTVFYPDKPGRNYITVRGFRLSQAATPWAPPTAEQIGLIGTHWSKGWLIESNIVSHSACGGIALGKYGDEFDNAGATAEAYQRTIRRALTNGWNKATVGSHIVRNNEILHCEQVGIVGSLGCSFSRITGNVIHDINMRGMLGGFEPSGIKFHGAIDMEISGNHIFNNVRGIWLDWMAQNTRISRNLFHGHKYDDIFLEADHGPVLMDNNIFMSKTAFRSASHGAILAHNIVLGALGLGKGQGKMKTPFFKPHSTEIDDKHGEAPCKDHYYNNLFVGTKGLENTDGYKQPPLVGGNVYLNGAVASKHEIDPLQSPADPAVRLIEKPDGMYLAVTFDKAWLEKSATRLITTELIGAESGMPFENPDGTPLKVDRDYLGRPRSDARPVPGPFEVRESGACEFKVWPKE